MSGKENLDAHAPLADLQILRGIKRVLFNFTTKAILKKSLLEGRDTLKAQTAA